MTVFNHEKFLCDLRRYGVPEPERAGACKLVSTLTEVTDLQRQNIADHMLLVAQESRSFLLGIRGFYVQWLREVVPASLRYSRVTAQEQWARDAEIDLPWPDRPEGTGHDLPSP